jgi:F420-non-reducing hydrogenase iron-sulfur subunit
MTWIGASEGIDFAQTMREMAQQVKALGPNQLRTQMVL